MCTDRIWNVSVFQYFEAENTCPACFKASLYCSIKIISTICFVNSETERLEHACGWFPLSAESIVLNFKNDTLHLFLGFDDVVLTFRNELLTSNLHCCTILNWVFLLNFEKLKPHVTVEWFYTS